MSLAGYLFGNVDEQGRLDSDLDEELKQSLQHVDAGVFSRIFNADTFGLRGDQDEDSDKEEEGRGDNEAHVVPMTRHADNAIDFSDINEAIADDAHASRHHFVHPLPAIRVAGPSMARQIHEDDDYDEDEDEEMASPVPARVSGASPTFVKPAVSAITPPTPVDLARLFPHFDPDKIPRFSELFMTRISRRRKLQPTITPLKDEDWNFELDMDHQQLFLHQPFKRRKITEETPTAPKHVATTATTDDSLQFTDNHVFHSVVLDNWENDIHWDSQDDAPTATDDTMFKFNNHDVDDGGWMGAVIWDDHDIGRLDPENVKVMLDLNDPNMLFDAEYMEEAQQSLLPAKHVVRKGRKPNPRPPPKMPLVYTSDPSSRSKLPKSRYNISNDKHYDMNFAVVRVRQTHGQLVVQHAIPALQLHRSLYKTRLTKSEMRSFHRPHFRLPLNTDINFSKVRVTKKKPKKKGSSATLSDDNPIRSTKDLTLKDTSNFVLWEYSEENPPIISNVGMGTLITNCYRKTDPKDDHVPHMDLGDPMVLEVEDTSPFMTFGNVEAGQTIQVMCSNMLRAPLFRHKVKTTDFLLVRSTFRGQSKYYLRAIPALFVLGQTYPIQEVPGPQSRRITTTVRNRLQIIAYRLMKKHPQQRLKLSKLASRFPEYQDIQVRQRLKEFLEFHRRSKDGGGGYWKVRQTSDNEHRQPPNEDVLRQMCTPEMVCLYESMVVGERHLQDLGYSNMDMTEPDDMANVDQANSQLETEQQLAPWFATRNFINACQGKAMLKLSGDGDPTGCGEGFSFIRVSMKDIFLRAGESAEDKLAEIKARPKSAHRYNVAEQQQVYKEEIQRIWDAQWTSLSRQDEPEFMNSDTGDEADERDLDQISSPMTPDVDWRRRYDRSASEGLDDDDAFFADSFGSQLPSAYKELRITRFMRQPDGEVQKFIEIIRDPAVIKAYTYQRQLIMEHAAEHDGVDPSNPNGRSEQMKKQTQQRLARLRKVSERRRQRQFAKTAALAENPVLGLIRGKREGAMRKCGNCGQLGHMKTNKSCPMFYIVNGPDGTGNKAGQATDANSKSPMPSNL
ncbi:hypothetical protein BC940DRAFT_296889 [Gongronella butleri]|nr:hypothetical protein BC940DRAFT_296889 [Gongronella butleri]